MIDVKMETARRLEGVVDKETVFQLFTVGLITERSATRFLVTDEFRSAEVPRGCVTELKDRIAEKYCLSVETIQKYISKKL